MLRVRARITYSSLDLEYKIKNNRHESIRETLPQGSHIVQGAEDEPKRRRAHDSYFLLNCKWKCHTCLYSQYFRGRWSSVS